MKFLTFTLSMLLSAVLLFGQNSGINYQDLQKMQADKMATAQVKPSNSFSVNPNALIGKTVRNFVSDNAKAETMISQSVSQDLVEGSIACGSGGIHAENSYYRAFDLANDFAISADWVVSKIDVGVEIAAGYGGTQPVWVKLYTSTSTDLTSATLTLLYEEEFAFADADMEIVQLEFASPVTVPSGEILAVEILTPDGATSGNAFYIGSNDLGQNAPSYIRAPECGLTTIGDIASVGFPDMHIVLNVWGSIAVEPGAPAAVTDFTVTPDATGALTVDFSWTNPSLTYDGSELTELTSIDLYINAEETPLYSNETPVIGGDESQMDIDLTTYGEGMHTFLVVGTNSAGIGMPSIITLWVGEDMPAAPSNVVLSADGNSGYITWEAPTEGLHNGYFDGTTLTYTVVRFPDEIEVASDITETEFTDNTVPGIGNYYYQVTASNDAGEGGAEISNVVLLGAEGYLIVEDFEEGWPPVGWTNNGWDLSTYGSSYSGEEFAYSNLAGSTLTTPSITVPADGAYVLSFFYRAESANYPQDLSVKVSEDDGPFTSLIDYTGLNNATYLQAKLSLANYAGSNIKIQFVGLSGEGGWDFGVLVDYVTVYKLYENDLAATSIKGNSTPTANSEVTFTVTVANYGTVTQNDYAVKLFGEGDVELASVDGESVDYDETVDFELSWTPTVAGETFVYGKVVLAGDEALANNQTSNLPVLVLSEDIEVVTIGEGTDYPDLRIPFDFYYKNSFSQTLYFPNEIGVIGGSITGLSYTNNFVTNLPDKAIKVWIGETSDLDLSAGWVDPSSLTLVFDGIINFPDGENTIVIPFSEPYEYSGNNLVVYTNKVWEDVYFSSSDLFYGTLDEGSNRTRSISADGDAGLDPLNPGAGVVSSWHPNTKFFVSTDGLGAIEGVVTDGTDPLEGVEVGIAGTLVKTLTNELGEYSFPYLKADTYDIDFGLFGYQDLTEEGVVVEEDLTTTLNAVLTAIPTYTVTGVVKTNDDNDVFIEGAVVTLQGYDDFEATTDAYGEFSIADVFEGEYTVTVTYIAYENYTADVTVDADTDLGDIVLTEIIVTPSALMIDVDHAGFSALFSWNNADAYFADSFEDGTFDAWDKFIKGPGTPGEGGYAFWYPTTEPDGGEVPDGSYVAKVDWGYDIDTWLVSPLVTVNEGAGIIFNWYSSYYWSVDPNPNAELVIKVSTNGGSTWTPIWNWQEIGVWSNFTWYETTIDLDNYVGQTIVVAVHLIGNDNAVSQIDNVRIGTPDKFGTFAVSSIPNVAQNAKSAGDAKVEISKAFAGYNVYLNDMETPVNSEPITETSHLFEGLAIGTHTAGVKAVYSTGVSEMATIDFQIISVGVTPGTFANFSVYPNPFTSSFNISNPAIVSRVVITNLIGQQVLDIRTNGAAQIETGKLPSGIYLVTFETSKGERIIRKMVKK